MIIPTAAALFALAFAASVDDAKPDGPVCLGVAVPTGATSEVALLWIDVAGSADAIAKLKAAAGPLGVKVQNERSGPAFSVELVFDSNVKSADALGLFNRMEQGDFGQVNAKPFTMPIDVLPPTKCPRR